MSNLRINNLNKMGGGSWQRSPPPPLQCCSETVLRRTPSENKKRKLVTQHCIRGRGGGVARVTPYSVASSFKFFILEWKVSWVLDSDTRAPCPKRLRSIQGCKCVCVIAAMNYCQRSHRSFYMQYSTGRPVPAYECIERRNASNLSNLVVIFPVICCKKME
jgi:hypothetical protein